MNKYVKIAAFLILVAIVAAPALAQPAGTPGAGGAGNPVPLITFSGSFGAALVTIGAAMGIGRLAAAALESMARQPEVAGSIQTAMIIAAALIEGFTFYALFICSTGV